MEDKIEMASKILVEKLQTNEDNTIVVAVDNIAKLLPETVTPQMISSDSSYSDNFVTKCYSKVLYELCKTLNNKSIRSNRSLLVAIKKVFTVNNASALMFSESLIVLLSEFKETNGPSEKLDIIVEFLETLIKSDSLQLAMLDLCKSSKEETIVKDWVKTEMVNTVQVLISLPNHVSNKLGKKTPDCFIPEKFTKILTVHIVKCIVYLAEISRLGIDIDVKPLSVLLSKLIINYKTDSYLKNIFEILDSWCRQRDILFSQTVQNIIFKLDQKSLEYVAVCILRNCSELSVFRFLNCCVLKSEHWKYVLCQKIPFLMFFNDDKLLVNLIAYLGNVHKCFQTDENLTESNSILTDLLIRLISIWSDKFSLVHTPQEQHLYLTKLIVLSVKFISENKKELNIDDTFINTVKSKFFNGVPVHLDSSVEVVRVMGMIASEKFVKYLNNIIDDKEKFDLEFDYSKLKGESLTMVESVKNVVDLIPGGLKEEDGDDILYELLIECGILKSVYKEIESEVNDKPLNIIYEKSEVFAVFSNDDQLDSDDDFEPYDTTNDTKLAVKKQPSYLRDLIEGFREEKDADIWVGSLEVCETLIYKQLPQDDVTIGLEILDILLGLEKRFYCEDFEKMRFTAALAVVVVNPQQSAQFLCSKFHEDFRRYSIAHRMLMLDLLSGGARVLSGVRRETDKMEVNVRKFRKDEPYWGSIIKDRIENNTKRFFKPRNAPVMTENKFSKVAGSFLFPLLRGSTKTTQVITYHVTTSDSLKNDPHMLLVHFLQTCAIIMVSSVNCTIVLRMAKEVLEATWNLRFHTESKVREAVIGCIASVILSVPSHQIYSDLWEEISEAQIWLNSVANSEGIIGGKSCEVDLQCRAFAAQVTLLISDALDMTKDFS